MNLLVAIVGPTGTGKSRLAIHLAQVFNGEIVSADSRQVYCYMDIGTAKPAPQELSLVPHHLINIVNPDEDFSLAQYQELAYTAINNIQQSNKLPILAGGSGLYVWSVLEGWGIPKVPPNLEFRQSLEEKATSVGNVELYHELEQVDPIAARRIDPRNVRRIIRALEVHRGTKIPFPRLQRKKALPFKILIIGLTTDRGELYHRIDSRVDGMMRQGLVEETKRLLDMGYHFNLPAMSGVGYKQIGMFLRGEVTLAAATQQIKFETHRLARHQYSWFRLTDRRIQWFDIHGKIDSEVETLVGKFITGEQKESQREVKPLYK
jgi:tRNA dimethylallyltransferase